MSCCNTWLSKKIKLKKIRNKGMSTQSTSNIVKWVLRPHNYNNLKCSSIYLQKCNTIQVSAPIVVSIKTHIPAPESMQLQTFKNTIVRLSYF